MVANSTANIASTSGTVKQAKPSQDTVRVQTIATITQNSIDQYFPLLKTAPDILYISMAIWGMESNWNLWHKKANGAYDSAHLSPVNPGTSVLIGKGYYYSPVIRSFLSRPNVTAQEKLNVAQGFVAHGVSACMGCYHVVGTPNFESDFRPYFDNIVKPAGIYVNPGESITALFPNNDVGITRSVVSGLIILQNKFKIHLNNRNALTYQNPAKAIEAAVGSYVGRAGSRDINGYSPEDRQKDVLYTPSSRLAILASVGITRTGQSGVPWSAQTAALASANTASSSTPKSNTVSNSPDRVATSDGDPKKPIGCV